MAYDFSEIEKKWQSYWKENNIYKVEDDFSKPKYYVLDMFPYPSGAGLHIGHPEGYTATDIIARYKTMKGFNVLHPMGFDAFGLPTERYCMQNNIHPNDATAKNIENFRRQLDMIGLGYDWDRMINTTSPEYYKWTQRMFLLIYNSWFDHSIQKARPIEELPIPENLKTEKEIEDYKDSKRLAFIAHIPVNWCEQLGTVLANEEVDEWKAKGYSVERRPMRQWMIRITEYAQRLLDDLDLVEWPHSTMEMQKNWIGKSVGAEVNFQIEGRDEKLTVFTTRPDTIFGANYLVLAPEHKLTDLISSDAQKEIVREYVKQASLKSDLERAELSKEKTGVFTGAYAINPATGKQIPIWTADYVLAHYGFGAIMAVPGHDERDYEFAKAFNLPITQVVAPTDGSNVDLSKEAYTDYGVNCNSSNAEISIDGVNVKESIVKMNAWLEAKGIGKAKIQYKLRDWLFSRQRYWGEPMPIILFKDGTKRGLDPEELPLRLPDVTDFQPAGTGESPLAKVDSWVNFIDPKTGKQGGYETNTMPQWAGSCWYYLRYADPHNSESFIDKKNDEYWMQGGGVDLYVGGAEHAVLHLLYARFWHKVLFDYGHLSTPEPFKKLFHQGLIMGADGRKMSKSLGNVVNPDDVIRDYGADSLRLYEMFLGPLEASKPWSMEGIGGVNRFLNRVWRLIAEEDGTLSPNVQDIEPTPEMNYHLHLTIKKIGEDIENLSFNTAVSQMMIFVNEYMKFDVRPISAMKDFVLCLAPFAPHICEELWRILGEKDSIVKAAYPKHDDSKIVKQTIEFVVQVNSKIRAKLNFAPDLEQSEYETAAKADEKVAKFLEVLTIRKVIYVKNKLINFIAN
jgi:leucyl-tRNA synthetase